MKIEIDIDLESIIIEALKKKGISDIEVPPRKVSLPTATSGRYYTAKEKATAWEFGPKSGHRRTAEERAMHELERKHGRVLTPEEKGTAKGLVQIEETIELKAKEDTITKVRIDAIVAEGMAAATKEIAEEERRDPDSVNGNGVMDREEDNIKEEPEATIPKTKDLGNLNSLFS